MENNHYVCDRHAVLFSKWTDDGNDAHGCGKHAPFINRINPAALISDCFYTLNNYDNLQRFATDLLTLSVMAVLFFGISCLVTRRKTYASL